MNIYTIFTGGTIGSKKDVNSVIKTSNNPYKLIDEYNKVYGLSKDNFVTDEPYRILSENLSAENILTLVKTINKALMSDEINGIIITHGTDTLQYTASMLGYIFADISIPIILVSANFVIDDVRSNGLYNFKYAVDFIKTGEGKGVFVSYKNTNDIAYIHRGTRLQNPVLLSDDLTSVMDSWYGRFVNGKFEKNDKYKAAKKQDNSMFDRFNIRLTDTSYELLIITPYVGMNYPYINNEVKAILHKSFHSGTINISKDLEKFVLEADKRHIPIFLTGLNSNESQYETVNKYRSYGIVPLRESSTIAQYCKLWLALSNNKNIMEVMSSSIGDDFICN